MAGWNHDTANWTSKTCNVCGSMFTPKSGAHKFCSIQCKGRWKYITGSCCTEEQYKKISGNWYKYFQRLCNKNNRNNLTTEMLLQVYNEQEGKCALSGVPLTCTLIKGTKVKTNASIDRIHAGTEYSIDNIQLVCSALNSWRADTDLQEFVWWCKQVALCQEKEGTRHA